MKFLYLDHKPAPSKKRERDGSFVEIPPTEFVPYNVIEKNFQSLIKANLKSEDSDNVLTAMEEYLKSAMKNQTMKMENVMPAKRISQYFIYLRDKQPEIYHSVMQRFKYKLVGSDYAYPIMIIISESKESEKISDFTAGRNLASCTEFEEFRKTLEEEEKNSSSNQSEEVSGIDWLKYIPCFPTNHPDPLFKIEEHFQAVGPSKVIFTSEEAKAQFPEELKSRHLGVKWYTIGRNDHGLMEFLKHAKDPLVLIGFELIPANPFATNLLLDVLLPWLFHHEKKTIQKSIKIRHYIQYDSGAQKTDTVLRGWHDFVCRVLVLAEVYKMDINCENLVSCIKNVEIVDFLIEKIRQAKGIPTYLNELNVFEKAETCQEFQPTYLLAEAFKTEKKIERNVDAGSLIQCAIQLIEMASIFVSFDQKHSSMFSEMVTQALSIFDEDIKDRTQFVLKAFTTEKEKCETADKLCMWAERVNKQDMLQIIHQVSDI
ncbi:hypothetical protein PSENEW3n2_00000623 [Picochlorum sp. SENEW3]|nr:hypothetical protein PSENEW3n2_00000623 [Picochlorum sp. SENEW3]WPT15543.1 hypothetical protein PSENEW3_00000623 [Picochlorum sp. SENEW3]